MRSFLQKLADQYPEKGSEIFRLAANDAEFCSICEEIDIADTARAVWKDMPERAREFEEILKDRMDEFWARLSNGVPRSDG